MRSAGAGADRALRRFVDLQLLITMQCEADRCVALNGALALELYRFGVFWVDGGPAGVARVLADAFVAHGGALQFRTRATFPGQGTIGATLSGLNAWRAVLDDAG